MVLRQLLQRDFTKMLPDRPRPRPRNVDHPKYVDAIWFIYIVSVVAACSAELVTYPLDLVKTRLQIQGEQESKRSKRGKVVHRGMVSTAIDIATREGITKLWQGYGAMCARHAVYSGTRIIVYKSIKEKVFKPQDYFPVWQSAVCGLSAGAIAQFIASPTDLLKVQLQMEGKRRLLGYPPRVHGMIDAFQKIYAAGGVKGLWKGAVPNVQYAALVTLGNLSTYDVCKRFIMRHANLQDGSLLQGLASTCASFTTAVLATPVDVIKSRIMNQPSDEKGRGLLYSSSVDCLKKTVQLEGAGALYKGFFPMWMRMGPWAVSFWLAYERVVKIAGAKSW